MTRKLSVLVLILMGTAFFSPGTIWAAYPEKPITLICVWGPGGANDTIARSTAESMKKYFPQPMVVVNRAGGAGTIGSAEIIAARPDGYTIGVSSGGPLTIKPHQMKLPYKTPDDYAPIALIGYQAEVLSVSAEAPFRTLQELVQYAKGNPGKLRVATTGAGGLADLIVEQLKFLAQIDVSDVPSKSGGEQIALLLGKHVDAIVTTTLEILPQFQAGKVHTLALADQKRTPMLPETLTFKEGGYEITLLAFSCLIGPKGLGSEIVAKLQEGCSKVCRDGSFIKQMEAQGFTVLYEGPEDLKKRLWKDYNLNKTLLEQMEKKK